jgi:hypothetical protein
MPPLNEDVRKEVMRRIERSAAFQRVFSGADGELAHSVLDFIDNAMNQDVESARKVLEEQNQNAGTQ